MTTNGDGTVDWQPSGGGGGGLTNPLTTTLDCDSNNIINVGTFNTNLSSFILNTEGAISNLQTDTTALQTKTQNITAISGTTVITGDLSVVSINITTKIITQGSDFGTPVGDFYVLTDNINYRIQGTVLLSYGIQFGANNSVCGDGLNTIIIFDESTRNCQIKSTLGQQVLMTDVTIQNGGGRFSLLSTKGLFDCTDIDTVTGVAPFFGRSKRFYLNNVATLRVYNIGFVKGFGTISVNNCVWNGGAGISGQPESYYTNYGISFQAGLSCEINNCKIVLFKGLYFVTTNPMIKLGSNIVILGTSVGFNAVEISDNIIHPRGTERGLLVTDDCTTGLGNIGNNVFISETSTVLIDYGATTEESKGSYNTPNMIKYIVNSNAGISNSSVSLRSNWTTTNTYSSASLQTIELALNSQMATQQISNRIGVRMNITTTLGAWQLGRIDQLISGASAVIVYVESANVVYISDQNNIQFDSGTIAQGALVTQGNNAVIATEYIFVEKEPRRVSIMASLTAEVDSKDDDMELTVGYDEGAGFVDDIDGMAVSFAQNNKPNQVVYISVKQLKFGDKFHLRVSTVGADQLNITKIHIGVS